MSNLQDEYSELWKAVQSSMDQLKNIANTVQADLLKFSRTSEGQTGAYRTGQPLLRTCGNKINNDAKSVMDDLNEKSEYLCASTGAETESMALEKYNDAMEAMTSFHDNVKHYFEKGVKGYITVGEAEVIDLGK